jgi:hypothetical protein
MTTHYSGLQLRGNLFINKELQPAVVWVSPLRKALGPYGSDLNPSKDVDITFVAHASDPNAVLVYSVVVGVVPDGLTLDSATGKMVGTLTASEGLAEFTVRATIQNTQLFAERHFRMVIGNAPPPVWITPAGLIDEVGESETYTTTLLAEDPYELPVTYFLVGGSLPPGMFLNSTTGQIYGSTPDLDDDMICDFTVSASNNSRNTTRDFTIYLTATPPGDAAYWITPAGDVGEGYELTEFTFDHLEAIDPNALPITYVRVAGNIPDGLMVDANSGVIYGTMGPQADDTLFKFIMGARTSVYTTKRMFTIMVKHVTPPSFGDDNPTQITMRGLENEVFYSNAVHATSPTPIPITYTITNLPTPLIFSPFTAEIHGIMPPVIEDADHIYNMVVTASNGIKSKSVTVQLTDEKNLPPYFTVSGSLGEALGGKPFNAPVPLAIDPNGVQTVYTLLNPEDLPESITWDASVGLLTGTYPPAPTEDVITTFQLQVFDGVFTTNATLTITSWLNTEPEWITAPGQIGTIIENHNGSFVVEARDPQNEPIIYSRVGGAFPPGMDIDPNTGAISGPDVGPVLDVDFDIYDFVIRADDGVLFTDRAFRIVVTKDYPPIWDTQPGVIVDVLAGKQFTFQLEAHDPNGTTPVYSVIDDGGLPIVDPTTQLLYEESGVIINGRTIRAKMPQPSNPADESEDFNLIMSIDDGYNPPVERTFTLRTNRNTPPVWNTNIYASNFVVVPTTANIATYQIGNPLVKTETLSNGNVVIYSLLDQYETEVIDLQLGADDPQTGVDSLYYFYSDSSSVFEFNGQEGVGDDGVLFINQNTGRLTGRVPTVDADKFWHINVTAYDKTEVSMENRYYGTPQRFLLSTRFNKPPEWITAQNIGRVERLAYTLQFNAINKGNLPEMQYVLNSGVLPANMTLTNTGVLSTTLPPNKTEAVEEDKTYTFAVTANNGIKQSTKSFNFTVYKNLEPVWEPATLEGLGQIPFTGQISATDPNQGFGDPLVYTIVDRSQVPSSVKFNIADPFGASVVSYQTFDADYVDYKDAAQWSFVGNPALVPGKFGNAVSMDGTSYLTAEVGALGQSPFTFETWFKRDGGGPVQHLITLGDLGENGVSLYLDNGVLKLDEDTINVLNGTASISDTAWHHVALVRDGNDYTIYLDGVVDAQITMPTVASLSATTLLLGSFGITPDTLFTGALDDFRLTAAARYTQAFTAPTKAFDRTITGVITGNLPLVQADAYYPFDVSVSDNLVSVPASFTIHNIHDQDPMWSTPMGLIYSNLEDTPFTLTVGAADPEANQIAYSLFSGTFPFTLNSVTGEISGTLPSVSTDTDYDFTLRASDGIHISDRSFRITSEDNLPPVWVSCSTTMDMHALGGEFSSYQFEATDPNGRPTLTYAITGGTTPPGLNFGTGGALTGTLNTVQADQDYTFDVTVSDGVFFVPRTFTYRALLNRAPYYVPNATTILTQFEQTFIADTLDPIDIYDPDGSELTIQVQPPQFPLQYHVDNAGTDHATVWITGGSLPAVMTDTTYQMTILADDGVNFRSQQYAFRVKFNSPPSFTSPATFPDAVEQTPYYAVANAVSNGMPVFYAVVGGMLPPGLTLNVANGAITGTAPLVDDDQQFPFQLQATTGIKATVQDAVITVRKNLPPVWLTTTLANVMENTVITPFQLVATDPNHQAITYTWLSGFLPPGLTANYVINPNTVTIIGNTPILANDTVYNFRVGASDGYIRTDRDFVLTVKYNQPPVWVTNAGLIATVNEQDSLSNQTRVIATDPEVQGITYAIHNTAAWPGWLTLQTNGFLTGTAPQTANGFTTAFEIDASDGNRFVTRQFSINVQHVGTPPTWITPAGQILAGDEGNSAVFTLVANDNVYHDTVTYALNSTGFPSTMTLLSNGYIYGTYPSISTTTTYTFDVAAINVLAEKRIRQFSITSNNVDYLQVTSPTGVNTYYGKGDVVPMTTEGEWTVTVLKPLKLNGKLWGAGGGTTNGGAGGFTTGDTATLTTGTILRAWVGGGGFVGSPTLGHDGPFGNGGNCGRPNGGGISLGTGGGLTGLFLSSVSQGNALLVAGAGGGGGTSGPAAGAGGGTVGAKGNDSGNGGGGFGGTQTSGGARGGSSGFDTNSLGGSALTGGRGAANISSIYSPGGGGAGYWGGGAGYGNNQWGGAGGGGSGYLAASITNGSLTAGSGTTPANANDSDRLTYAPNAGSPGLSNTSNSQAPAGLMVLRIL